MPQIRPFKAMRPANDKVHLVASRSYVTYSDEQLRDKLKNNPYSFVQIIHPDFNSDQPSDPGTPLRFERVRDKYHSFVEQGVIQRDLTASFYVYRQKSTSVDSIGVIAAASANDYRSGRIKIHEQTLASREALFADYLQTTGFNAEPILLTHNDHDELNNWLSTIAQRAAEVHFTTADGVTHWLWPITQKPEIDFIRRTYNEVPDFYIADGHHRSASSVLLSDRLNANGSPINAGAHFMVYIIPASRLCIHGYHRLVRHQITKALLINQIEQIEGVTVQSVGTSTHLPTVRSIDVYIDSERFRIEIPQEVSKETPDAAWLTEAILTPILGINDLRNDPRIHFEPETVGTQFIMNEVNSGKYKLAFFLHPVPFKQLKAVADRGETMPPKSTWIEPKLRSGLVIYDFTYPDTLESE